jgi:hypothetical protein
MLLSQMHALFGGENSNRRTPDSLSVPSGFSKARSNPLPNQRPLELCDCPEYLEDQLAGGQRGVNGLGCRHEVNPKLSEQFECRDELSQRPGEAVELLDKHSVEPPLPRVSQQLIERRSLLRRAGEAVVRVGPLHRPIPVLRVLPEFVLLRAGGLVIGGNARVNCYSYLPCRFSHNQNEYSSTHNVRSRGALQQLVASLFNCA